MAEIINLTRARKQRAAQAREADAQQNRMLHGRTKAEKQRDRLEHDRATRQAENARLDPPEE
jgi:hypothetical protein